MYALTPKNDKRKLIFHSSKMSTYLKKDRNITLWVAFSQR